MKKIYSVTLILLCIWAPSLLAQNNCPPAANVRAFYGTVCYVSIQNSIPNAQVNVQNALGATISPLPAPFTDASGNAIVAYDCGSTPSVVNITAPGQLCQLPVPAPISLPIKLKAFTVQTQNDKSVMLRWTSVLETNSSKYVIQKSVDGRNFVDLDEVKGAGSSTTVRNYSYIDADLASGTAYYRLKLVDIDGTVDFTKILYINSSASTLNLSVFPNPFRGEIQLKGINTADVNRNSIRVFNTMGSEVGYRVIGGNAIVIDPSLPKGVYILRVKGQAVKLFKE